MKFTLSFLFWTYFTDNSNTGFLESASCKYSSAFSGRTDLLIEQKERIHPSVGKGLGFGRRTRAGRGLRGRSFSSPNLRQTLDKFTRSHGEASESKQEQGAGARHWPQRQVQDLPQAGPVGHQGQERRQLPDSPEGRCRCGSGRQGAQVLPRR
jgi:hypothetical protein